MAKKKKSKRSKKNQTPDPHEEEYKKAPHSFVFHRGHVGRNIKQLVHDTRMVMEPFTAKRLQVRKKNVLKDFVSVAGVLNVSHFIIYTKTDVAVNMRLCRLPRGPTLTFKVHNYSLISDVVSSLKKPNLEQIQYLNHPLLVMNNFSGEGMHMKLMSTMFQNMFPSINVHKVKLNDVRRCLLVNYNSDTKLVDLRHYNIKVVPVGMSRNVKKLAVQAKIPDLSKYKDISDYMNRLGYSSESEVELDGPASEVVLPQTIHSRGNIKAAKSAVRLTELGPRLTLQLVKVEDGICEGEVMFHEFIHKTDEELKVQQAMRKKKKQLKEIRKKQQAENVRKKEEEKEKHKQKSLEGIKRKAEQEIEEVEVENPELNDDYYEDDDVEYYKQEVGKQPDSDTFLQSGSIKRKKKSDSAAPWKKRKIEKNQNKAEKDWKTGEKKQKLNNKDKSDLKSNKKRDREKESNKQRDRGKEKETGKKYDRETNVKKGKKANMTIQQRLKLKKKQKQKMKEKKMPKHKRKLLT